MSDTGWKSGTIVSSTANPNSTIEWVDVVNVLDSDNAYATATFTVNQQFSNYIYIRGFDFAIPSGTISWYMEVEIEHGLDNTVSTWPGTRINFNITKDGVIRGDGIWADINGLVSTDTITYGTFPSNIIPISHNVYTANDINSENFGIMLWGYANDVAGGNTLLYIDRIRAKVTYVCVSPTIYTTSISALSTCTSATRTIYAGPSGGTLTISAGSLPTGMALGSTTVSGSNSIASITGTPTAAGTYNFTVTYTITCGSLSTSRNFSLIVNNPSVSIITEELDNVVIGTAYTATVSASGAGSSGYHWSVNAGTLHSGLTLATATGVISGTPTSNDGTDVTIRVEDDCSGAYYDKVFTILASTAKSLSDLVSSVTETITLTTSTFEYSIANNNQAYVLNKKIADSDTQHGWSFCDTAPFVKAIYRAKDRQMIGVRRDQGNISRINYGDTFDGSEINSEYQTGYMNIGLLDEVKELAKEHNLSEAVKKLRAYFADVKGEGDLTLTIYSDQDDTTGQPFTIDLATTDNTTLNAARVALSRDIRGKYVSFKIANVSGNDFWMGEQRLKILPKQLK